MYAGVHVSLNYHTLEKSKSATSCKSSMTFSASPSLHAPSKHICSMKEKQHIYYKHCELQASLFTTEHTVV